MLMNEHWQTLAIVYFVGVACGVFFARSYILIQRAVIERRERGAKMTNPFRGVGHAIAWIRSQPYANKVVTGLAVMLIVLGSLQIVAYYRFTAYENCQAQYNQDAAKVRQTRQRPINQENTKLFQWIQSLPPLIDPSAKDLPPRKVQALKDRFSSTLDDAIAAHKHRVTVQDAHPYPKLPANLCGGKIQ